MDVYSATSNYISSLPITQPWPEFQTIFRRIAAFQPKHWLLPLKSCLAVGGSVEQALPAVAAVACAQIGIVLLDDMLDDDPRGEYHRLGPAVTANLAAAFQFAALECLSRADLAPESKLRPLNSANRMLQTVAFGQQLDIQSPTDEASYWRVVAHKSASFFGTALLLGAILGGASDEATNAVGRFGQLYGEMIQIHDDLDDSMAVPAGPDWIQKRAPLPILFAREVNHPFRHRFLELYENVTAPEALREAQEILIHCGAVSYCVDQLLQRHQAVKDVLKNAPLATPQPLENLAREIVEPVWKLLNAPSTLTELGMNMDPKQAA